MPQTNAICRTRHQMLIGTHRMSLSELAIYHQFRSIADHTRLYRYYSPICTLSLAFIRMDHLPEIRKDKWYVFVLHC
jgi:hypothetical protein